MTGPRKQPNLPHHERPSWTTFDRERDLYYLGWGLRNFGQHPAFCDSQGGWSYTLILDGSLTLATAKRSWHLSPNQAVLLDTSVVQPAGFRDERHACSKLLIWVWRTPPAIEALRNVTDGCSLCVLNAESRMRFEATHALCRQEVERWDTFSPQVLEGLRVQLDAAFARCLQSSTTRSERAQLGERAVRWLEQHLRERNAIFLLCDYLQISWSTLERLFHELYGKSPSAFHLEMRMQKAEELRKQNGWAVKQIAFALGYKHVSDFSRAWRKFRASKSESRSKRHDPKRRKVAKKPGD